MRRLLLALDGSECSAHALAHVIALGAEMPLRVWVLNVQRSVSGDVSMFVSAADLERHHRDQGDRIVQPALAELQSSGIECTGHVLVGTAGESIARYAEERGLDGIVMGTRGLGSVAGALLGSVAFKVVHLAGVPVTLVK